MLKTVSTGIFWKSGLKRPSLRACFLKTNWTCTKIKWQFFSTSLSRHQGACFTTKFPLSQRSQTLATSTLPHFTPLNPLLFPSKTYAKWNGYGQGQHFTSKHFESHRGALTYLMQFLTWLGHSLPPNSAPQGPHESPAVYQKPGACSPHTQLQNLCTYCKTKKALLSRKFCIRLF